MGIREIKQNRHFKKHNGCSCECKEPGFPVLVGTIGFGLHHFPSDDFSWVLVPVFSQKWDSVLVSFFQLVGSVSMSILFSFFKLGRFLFSIPYNLPFQVTFNSGSNIQILE